jgi:hypothetical protein
MNEYTLKEFMAGTPLPIVEKEKSSARVYCYGVYLSPVSKKLCHFVCKDEVKVHGEVVSFKKEVILGELAVKLAQEMLEVLAPNYACICESVKGGYILNQDCPYGTHAQDAMYEQKAAGTKEGDIVIHADHHGQHTGILLEHGELSSGLLFVTSNPLWHSKSRQLTKDELSLLGYSIKRKPSYFAPVVRSTRYIMTTGREFPSYRVEQLKKEFGYGRK